ncbi:hypothetical protein ACFVRE_43350, partial [Streptomyces sp. NPDC057910]
WPSSPTSGAGAYALTAPPPEPTAPANNQEEAVAPLSLNEIRRMYDRIVPAPPAPSGPGSPCTGTAGDATTRHTPAPATTTNETTHRDNTG